MVIDCPYCNGGVVVGCEHCDESGKTYQSEKDRWDAAEKVRETDEDQDYRY